HRLGQSKIHPSSTRTVHGCIIRADAAGLRKIEQQGAGKHSALSQNTIGDTIFCKVLTILQPAICAVELYTSITAWTCSFLISMRWSSPTKSGVEVIDTRMFSGPTEAMDAATDTLTFVGNSRIASMALPSNTVFFCVCKTSSYTGVFRKE